MKRNNNNIIILLSLTMLLFTGMKTYAAEKVEIQELEISRHEIEDYEIDRSGKPTTYSMFSKKTGLEELVYDEIYKGLKNLDDEITITDFNGDVEYYKEIYIKVLQDKADIFYTQGTDISYLPGSYIIFKPGYIANKGEIIEMVGELEARVDLILEEVIREDMNDLQKELAVHDYIVANFKYDVENLNNKSLPIESYNPYGLLVKGKGVCQAYAESVQLLLNKLDIECIVVSSKSMNHAWNMVTINGMNYHLDATHNDPLPDVEGRVLYTYFNQPDHVMRESHIWDENIYPLSYSEDYHMFRNIESLVYLDDYIFYSSNKKGKSYIYRLNLKNLDNDILREKRAKNLVVKDNRLYYLNLDNNQEENIGISPPVEENYEGYSRWPDQSTKKLDKDWNIKFNQTLSRDSVNLENIYILDLYGDRLDDVEISLNEKGDTINIKPRKNYESKVNYLHVENIRSKSGGPLKHKIKMKFIID